MKLPFWMILLIFAAEASLIAILVPSSWIEDTIRQDRTAMVDTMGEQELEYVVERADSWFKEYIIDSNLLLNMTKFLIPSDEEKEKSEKHGMGGFGEQWFDFVSHRLEALQLMAYQMMSRLSLLLTWLPYISILLIPALYDGYNTRQIKKTNFDYASPIVHKAAIKIAGASVIVMFTVFLSPFSLPPLLIPAAVMVAFLSLGVTIGNMQKKV